MSELWRKAKARDMKHVSTMWPVGQVVKTAASHAVNIGSNPVRVTKFFLDKCAKALYNLFVFRSDPDDNSWC